MSNIEEYRTGTAPWFPNNDNDYDGLKNMVEDNTGVFQDLSHTGTDPVMPDTDNGGELDGLEAFLGRNPNTNPSDDINWTAHDWVSASGTYDNKFAALGLTDADTLVIAYEYPGYNLASRRWTGSAWSGVTYQFGALAEQPKLRKDPMTKKLHVFWKEIDSGLSQRRVHRAEYQGTSFANEDIPLTRNNELYTLDDFDVVIGGNTVSGGARNISAAESVTSIIPMTKTEPS
jgi:hypothetical protein